VRKFLIILFALYSIISINESNAVNTFDSLKSFYDTKLGFYANNPLSELAFNQKIDSVNDQLEKVSRLKSHNLFNILDFVAGTEKLGKHKVCKRILKRALLLTRPESVERSFVFFRIGIMNKYLSETIPALENFLKASLILEEEVDHFGLSHVYINISLINYESTNNEIALEYAELALNHLLEFGVESRSDSATLGLIYSVKGILNRRLENYEEAIQSIDKSIKINQAFGDSVRVAISKGNKAVIFYETGDYSAAEPLLRNDYLTSLENGVKSSAFNAGITLCNIYLKNNEQQKLDTLFSEISSMKENEDINFNNRQLLEFYKLAADVFENEENDSLSKDYLSKYILLDKKIDSIKKVNDIGRLQEKYLMEKEITKLELLQKTNELQASHLKLRTALLFIIGFAFLVVLWYVYVLRHKNRKIDRLNEMLEAKVSERTTRLLEINKELDNYLYRASHDIRRPIRTLLGLNNVVKFTDDPDELKMLFSKVHDTAMNMDEMLFKLQMAYELNNNHSLEAVEIKEVIANCINDQKRLIEYKDADVQVEVAEKARKLRANAALIKIAIDNILENALIYHNEDVKPEVEITTDIGKYFFYIHIQDKGYGIDENYQEKIFESYFKISNKTQGSGLGLFLAQRAISYLAGEITVESVINEGTKFTIKLPINPK